MIKILFLTNSVRAGGKERQLVELLKGLAINPEFKCEIATMNSVIHYKEINELGYKINFLIRKVKKDPMIFFKLLKICNRFKPDIIHTWDTMTSIYATPIAKILRITLLNGSIRVAPQRVKYFSRRWFYNIFTFPFADRVLANSKAGLYSYRINTKKGICIYNGFDASRIHNLRPATEIKADLQIKTRYLVCMVANFTDSKDYNTYIGAALDITSRRNDISFLGIGKGKNLEHFRESTKSNDYVILPGRMTNIEAIVNACDIGVLMTNPDTHGEGISNSIMEYMALAKPVIASAGGGTAEIVNNNITGFIISPKSVKDLIINIEYLIDNANSRKSIGLKGLERINQKFSIERMTTDFSNLFSEMVE